MSRRPLAAWTLLALALPTHALAADLTLLPSPAIAADGDAESQVYLLCDACSPDGRVSAKSPEAEIVSATMLEGFLLLSVRPSARSTPGTIQVQVRGTGTEGKFNTRVSVPVTPVAGRIDVSADADWTEPGGAPVALTLRAPPGPQDPALAQYAVRASGGTLGPVTVDRSGVGTVVWTPPEAAKAPQRIVVGVVDLAFPDRRVGFTSVPLRVQTDLSFQVPPDSSNVLVVGGERIGPTTASPSGGLAFSVALPPDEAQAVLETTTRQGVVSSQPVDLPLGVGTTHLVLPVPALLPADGRSPVPVAVATLSRDGTPSPAPPSIEASRGTLTPPTAGRLPGLFVSEWTAPKQTGTVEFTATQDGRSDQWQSTLVEGLPVVSIAVDPDPLPADATRYTILTSSGSPALGLAGGGLPRIEDSAGRVRGRAQRRDAEWTLPMSLPESSPGTVVQSVGLAPASDQPLAGLVAWATPPLEPGGAAFVTVAAVDAVGLPRPDLELELSVPTGSGSLPPAAKTDKHGVVHLRYDLGTDKSPSVLEIAAEGHRLPVVVLPGNQPGPEAGGAAYRALLERWQQAAPTAQLRRAEPPPQAIATAPSPPAAAPAPVASTAEPEAPAPASAEDRNPTLVLRPADDGPRPWGRVGVDAAFLRWTLAQTAQSGGVGPLALESELGFDDTLRGQVRALLFPGGGNWGLDLQGGWLTLPQASASTTAAYRAFEEFVGAAGVRYRDTLSGPVGFHVLAQAERTPAFLHLYDSGDPAALNGRGYSVTGARFGGGLQVDARWFYLETTVSETFAFAPVNLRATAALDLPVQRQILLRLSGGYDWRSMAFEVAEEDVRVEDTLFHTGVGLTIPLR